MTILQAIEILQLEVPTTPDSIKKAYRQQAKQWHPDNFRLYEQQIEAGHYFIKAKAAFDMLAAIDIDTINNYKTLADSKTITRNRAAEGPAYNNDYLLFKTPLFKEAENIFSLFYLFTKWKWFGLPSFIGNAYTKATEYIKPHRMGLGPTIARFIVFIIIMIITTIITIAALPLLVCACILFVPLMWLYIKSIKWLTNLFKKILGYLPAPNCGHIVGELIYLAIRSLIPLVLLVVGLTYINYSWLNIKGWLFISGYLLFIVLINISVLYEWVSFTRVQYLRAKIKF